MAYTSGHDKEMEYFVGAEAFMSGIEQGELQRIDYATHCIDDTACQKPQKGCGTQGIEKASEYQHTYPSHGDINDGGKPFGAGDPAKFDEHTDQCDSPDESQQGIAQIAAQNDEAHGGVGTGDEHEDHHVVQFAEDAQVFSGQVYTVVCGAGALEQNHARHKDGHGSEASPAGGDTCFYQQRHCGEECHHHTDEMSNCASGFSYCNLHSNTSCSGDFEFGNHLCLIVYIRFKTIRKSNKNRILV